MKKSLWYAGLVVGILTASCTGNSATPQFLPNASLMAPNGVPPESIPQGWAATATQSVPIDKFATRSNVDALSKTMRLHIVVGLYMRDREGAQRLVRSQYTAGHAFHQWLTPAEFTEKFNPTSSQAAAVAEYLKRQGFTKVRIEPNHLIVSATGSVSNVEAAFHTSIRGTMSGGNLVYGNVKPALVPAKLHGVVAAVLGLTNAYHMNVHNVHQRVTRDGGTPPPCLEVVNGICIGGEYGPPQYQVAYDATNCPNVQHRCQTSIAVMAEGDISQVVNDLRSAESFWGLPKVPYSTVKVGTPSSDTSGLDEWDLDTQISSGMAQSVAQLYVYYTTSLSDSDTALEFQSLGER